MTIDELIAETLQKDTDEDADEPLEVFLTAEGEFVVEGGGEHRTPPDEDDLPIVALLN